MFYYLNGTVAEIGPNLAVIDCCGVGYSCATTNYTLAQLKKGEQAKLLSVSGVGPKAALAILSSGTPDQLALSIVTGDEKSLTGVPGIGKKIAQRIILELKDKLAKEQGSFDAHAGTLSPAPTGGTVQEAASALSVLGYSSQEISAALKGVNAALPVEEIIRQTLKKMVK